MSVKAPLESDKITIMFEMVYGLAVFDIQTHKNGWRLFITTIQDSNMEHFKNTLPMLGYYLTTHSTYKDAKCFITISKLP